MQSTLKSIAVVSLISLATLGAHAQVPVPLQNATATFSQTFTGDFSVARAINGTTADNLGWAIFRNDGQPDQTQPEIAAFETVTNVGTGSSLLTFTLTQTHSNPGHLIGRFRLSATTDDRSLFADGLQTGGDVTANWTPLDPLSLVSQNGTTLTELGDFSVLASGSNPGTDVYTVTAVTNLTGITGFRLEVLSDASLPVNGPGRFANNGNFVLSEFTVGIQAAAPEPQTGLLLLGLAPLTLLWRRRK